jgi:hypothetical protein
MPGKQILKITIIFGVLICIGQSASSQTINQQFREQYANPPLTSPKPTTRPNVVRSEESGSQMRVEALRMATNFLLKAQIPNAKILSNNEIPKELAAYNSAWSADRTIGAVKIIPKQQDVKGIDIAARYAAEDSRRCGGKFASGRVSELVDSEVVFRGFSTCDDSNGLRTNQYFIVPRRKGGFVIFSVMVVGGAVNQEAKEGKVADLRKAAFEATE